MDFEHSERAQHYIGQIERFTREHIVPNEQSYIEQLAHSDDWRQWRIPPIMEQLKAEAVARALRLADGPDEVHRAMVARLELQKYGSHN